MLIKLVALQFVIEVILCYTAVLERTELIVMNEKYLSYANLYVKRYSRRSPYYLNIVGTNKHEWNNNVSFLIDIQEKLSNMYKPSFINFRWELCNLIEKDKIFGTMLRKVGLSCPLSPGTYKLLNMTIALEDFPDVIPLEKGRANVVAVISATDEIIVKGYVYFTLIRNKSPKSVKKNKRMKS